MNEEKQHETAIHLGVVSHSASTPSMDDIPGLEVRPVVDTLDAIPTVADDSGVDGLMARARGGDSASFELLCAPHTGRLLKTAFKITGNREDAEDAVQDSLMRAFVRIHDFRGDSSFSTWLTRIVINSALLIRRKNGSAKHVFIDDTCESAEGPLKFEIPHSAPDPAQIFIARERRKALRKAISSLRPSLRSIVEVGQLQELSMEQAAKALNISIAAAKGRLFHARAALRRSAALRAIIQSRTEPAA
jgi:RNA polymerase sigma-70 factor (ECF subfamily)